MKLIRFVDHSGAIQYGEPLNRTRARPIRERTCEQPGILEHDLRAALR